MNKDFLKEISEYDLDDLRLIYDTQQDLYNTDEMQIIKSKISELENSSQTKSLKQFPKKIKCNKCDQYNPFENEACDYCKCKLNKSKYFIVICRIMSGSHRYRLKRFRLLTQN